MTDKAARPGKESYSSFLSPFDKGSFFKKFLSTQIIFWEKEKARWFYAQRRSQKRKGKAKVWRKKEVQKEIVLEKPYDYKALSYEIKVLMNLNMNVFLSLLDFEVDQETDSEEELFELLPEEGMEKGMVDNLALWDQERSFLEQNLDELSLLPLPMQNLMKQRLREVYGPGFGPG